MKRGIKAVLFDMDGVLIDAKDWHYEALNKALKLFGYEITRYEHLEIYDGLPTKAKLNMLTKEKGLPEALHQLVYELKQDYTKDYTYNNCKPTFNHRYALSKLKADGYKIAVCSNAIRESVEMMTDKAGLRPYVDLVLSNQDVSKSKPDPEIYTTAITSFGLEPSECLVVEDNEKGIKAAQAAGTHLLVVRTTEEVTHANILQAVEKAESQ